MTNQIIQEPKTDQSGKAIASLVIGILSIIPIIHYLVILAISAISGKAAFVPPLELTPLELMLSSLSTPGIILGIMGLESKQKSLAIGGIIFSAIGFLGLIYFSYMWWLAELAKGF